MGIAHVRDETVQAETGLLRQRGSAPGEDHVLPCVEATFGAEHQGILAMTMRDRVSELTSVCDGILEGAPEATAAQHAKGGPAVRKRIPPHHPEAMRAQPVKEYRTAELTHPYNAAERGRGDDVIGPAGTREVLIGAPAVPRTEHATLPARRDGSPPDVKETAMSSDFPVLGGPFGPTLFKVIRGTPSAEELAVLSALLTTLAAGAHDDGPSAPERAAWSRPALFPPASWMAGRRLVRR
jgi:hypothetical protein